MSFGSRKHLLFAFAAGCLLSYGVNYALSDQDNDEKVVSMENRIKELEALLSKKEAELKNAQLASPRQISGGIASAGDSAPVTKTAKESNKVAMETQSNNVQLLRDLEISPDNDRRSFVEKVNDLLADNPSKEKVAVAAKGIFDMAHDRDHLPDYALQTIYNNQSDPDLKRVVAQILAQRGNDTLLDDQVVKARGKLKSTQPRDRQDALVQLAKLRNVKAADAILPLLHDPDTDVKLDALLALRNNGNALNVGSVEMLRNDPSPAVRSLANDVANDLKDLSASARTGMSTSDIEAGLPPL